MRIFDEFPKVRPLSIIFIIAINAIAIPAIFNTADFSLYKYREKIKGITMDNLLATEATATPNF